MERDDEIWERMLLWTSERTGLSRAEIQKVVEVTGQFWASHLGLAEEFMSDEDL